ncbi:DUF4012 domain-containing protein [Candidatus Uhrbacteria bacterium]|nr:DUF4012 domain-containing protein [Candidatus Uhrbacteria bacterium]
MNFLAQYNDSPQPVQQVIARRTPRRRWFFLSLAIGIAFVILGGWVGLIVRDAVRSGYTAYEATMTSISSLQQKNFDDAHTHARRAADAWKIVGSTLDRIRWIRWVPFIGTYRNAGEDVADAGFFFSTALADGITLAEQLREPLGSLESSIDFTKLPREDRRTVLGALVETPERIRTIRSNLIAGIDHFDRARIVLPDRFVPKRLSEAREKLGVLERALDEFEDLATILPDFAGYPEPSVSLFIFQNNDELRPSGGFIGAYGLLHMDSGAITSLRTDDAYRLDNGVPKNITLPPSPAPIRRYLGVKKFFFRDTNWSPDFPTSATQLLTSYSREVRTGANPRGVIAITPTVIERIMQFTGGVTIDGITFTPENVTDVLEYDVEHGFAKRGISLEDRKVIIGKLTEELVARLHRIPVKDTPDLLNVLKTALEEKQIMVYHTDAKIQQQVTERGWSGSFPRNAPALFSVVDANLGSLKTDQVMERRLDIRVDYTTSRPRARVTMTYHNRGQFTWKTTRYQTYTRLYAPEGSTLVEGDGFMDRSRSTQPGKIDVGDELGYAVFGGFIAIEPGEERSLTYTIDLPKRADPNVRAPVDIVIPKQAGTIAVPLTLTLRFGTPVRAATPAEDASQWGDSTYTIQTDLRTDRKFSVSF